MITGLERKVVLITGGASRIGRATARAFAHEGARIVLTYYQDRDSCETLVKEFMKAGSDAMAVQLDLGNEQHIETAVKVIHQHFGLVSVLVSNAVAWTNRLHKDNIFENVDPDLFSQSIKINLEGVYRLTQAVVRDMRQAGWGRVIFVSSGLVEDGMPNSAAYVSAKAGLHGLTRTMSRELARDSILTNVVMPGFTRREDEESQLPNSLLTKIKNATATKRLTRPADVASLIVYLGASVNTHVSGELIRVDGHFLSPLVG